MIAFDERQGVTLTAPLPVNVTDPGTYGSYPNGSRKIAAGEQVDSHLIHSDPPGNKTTGRLTGTVTFPSDIIGVIGSTARLNASDGVLGAPGTTYASDDQRARPREGQHRHSGSGHDQRRPAFTDLQHPHGQGRRPPRGHAPRRPPRGRDLRHARSGDGGQRRAVHARRDQRRLHVRGGRARDRHAAGRHHAGLLVVADRLLRNGSGRLRARIPRRRRAAPPPSSW